MLRRALALSPLLAACFAAGAPAQSLIAADPAPRPTGAIEGELLVGFAKGADAGERTAARKRAKVKVKRALRVEGVQLVEVEAGTSDAAAIAALEREDGVRYAERNHHRQPMRTSNDPLLDDLWGLDNTGQSVDGAAALLDKDIDAFEAWDVITGGDTLVAVVDEGVAYDHPDLRDNMWTNPREIPGNGVDDDRNRYVDDVHGIDTYDRDSDPRDLGGHGTHVAGTIAAEGDNGEGIAGVAWRARLMAVRALGPGGGSDATVAEAFAYAGDMGARVVNASLGGPGFSQVLQDALDAHPNSLYVVSAGNGGDDGVGDNNDTGIAQYPCNYANPNLICVAATDQEDKIASFSNFGTKSVDIAAPGTEILSAAPDRGKVVFADDFETDDFAATWSLGGNGTAWGRTSEASHGPGFSAGDSPGAPYRNSAASYMETAIDVRGESSCVMDFRLEANLLAGDNFIVYANFDGSGRRPVAQTGRVAYSTQGRFVPVEGIDLGGDGSRLLLSFGVETDASGVSGGAHVDDVVVRCVQPESGAGEYVFQQGTSMATPHVSGAAALLFARNASLTVAQARAALLQSGDPVAGLAGKLVPVEGQTRRLNVNTLVRLPSLGPIDPVVSTGSASAVAQTTASLGGTVDPRGTASSYKFQYGPSASYGFETAVASAGAGSGGVPVSAPVSGLAAATRYHFRLVAVRGGIEFPGRDATFTTNASSGGTSGGGGTVTPVAPATLTPGGGGLPMTPVAPVTPVAPLAPATLSGSAKPLKKRVRRAKVTCANAAAKVTCKVTFPGAKRKKKVAATLKRGSATVAKGSAKSGGAKGLITIAGARGLVNGAYALSVKVGRTTYRFKLTLA